MCVRVHTSHTVRFGRTKARPNGCSQHHFTLKNGVHRRRVKGMFTPSVSWQTVASPGWISPRDPLPGSGPGCRQGPGRNKQHSLTAAPAGIPSQTGSQSQFAPWHSLKLALALALALFGNITALAASSLFWCWPRPLFLHLSRSVPSFWRARVPAPRRLPVFGTLRNKRFSSLSREDHS